MKFTTKSSAALVALLAASTIGGTVVLADSATSLDTTGKVTVEQGDTEDSEFYGIDPEKKGNLYNIPEVVVNKDYKGPIKLERASNLDFGSIKTQAKDINKFANSLTFDKQQVDEDGTTADTVDRGMIVQFADVRSGEYGYNVQAKLTEQFTTPAAGANPAFTLDASTITLNNGIIKSENNDVDNLPTLSQGVVLKNDGAQTAAVDVVKADGATKQGKGRYAIEFGQSANYDQAVEGAGKNGTKDTSKKAVNLFVPNKTASKMLNGNYTAKITWSINTTP